MTKKEKQLLAEVLCELGGKISDIDEKIDNFIKDFYSSIEEAMEVSGAVLNLDDEYQVIFPIEILKEMEKELGEKPLFMGLT